jgi:capsular exopolysaccharide synthesis family protein
METELHLRDYVRVLHKRRYAAAAAFVAITVVTFVKVMLETPIYRAQSSILVKKAEPYYLSLVNSYYSPWDPEFYKTQAQLIKSTGVSERVVRRMAGEERFVKSLGGDPRVLEEEIRRGRTSDFTGGTLEILAQRVGSGIKVTPVEATKIFYISYESSDPELAAYLANNVAEAYRDELFDMNMQASKQAIQWLGDKTEEERSKLRESEESLQAYVKEHDIVSMEYRLKVIPEELNEINLQLTKAITKRRELESVYNRTKSARGKPEVALTLSIVEADPAVQVLMGQILEAEQEVAELSKKYGEKHPAMKAALGDLQVLKEKQAAEIRRVFESVRKELELAKSGEENLQGRLTATKQEAFRLNEKLIQYDMLKTNVETNKQFYDTLVKKSKEHAISGQLQAIQVSVVERAAPPERPVRPDKLRGLLIGLLLGIFGGIGTAFFLDYLDNTVKSPEEVEQRTKLPVFGVIPHMKDKEKSVEEVVLKDGRSSFAESYKALRTSILLSKPDNPPKCILVTSTVPGEGKTATAVNLAVAIAQSGYKTVLVDGDLRRHRINEIFGLPNVKGLSTYLAGVSDSAIVTNSQVPNLSVITPGPVPPNPSEILSSQRMAKLMKAMRERYDMIVFDSSPVMTVSDGLVLSKYCDSALMVVRSGTTTYEMVRRGVKLLTDVKTDIMGVVVNALDEKKAGYYYYYKQYGYYYSDNGDEEEA